MLAKKVNPALLHNYFSSESHVLLQVTLIVAAQVLADICNPITFGRGPTSLERVNESNK